MKKAFALLLLVSAPSIWACPKLAAQHPQDLSVIHEYTGRLQQISDDEVYNKTIMKCFEQNVESISWDQTVALMGKLKDASYTNKSRSAVTEKMAENYLKANFDVTFADIAVEISNKMSGEDEGNKLIHDYFESALKRKMMNYEQVVILLNGLSDTGYYGSSSWSRSATSEKISRKFIKEKMSEITIPQIIQLAKNGRNSDRKTNDTLEDYFDAHIAQLSWNDTLQIIAALEDNSYDGRHTKSETRERITLKWNKAHN